jgi:DMSO/TMAO reductase YedYZ molybdopterin-dependent catalytic subunit
MRDFPAPTLRDACARATLRLFAVSVMALAPALLGVAGEPALTVVSPGQTLTLTADEFRALPHSDMTAMDPHQRMEHHYSGIRVRELLAKAGAPLGEKLRGKALQLGVVFHSKDGYATLFALAEFDDAFSDRTILLADREDGKPLPENAGPLRAVVPGDKRAARWARMVTSIEIVRLQGEVH